MAAPPYMQVWIADWTADVQHLSCEQDGAYWRLIRAMWRNHGSLQNEPRKLAHIAGLSPKKWAAICDDVLAFFDADGDVLRHGKLTETLISVSQKSAERSAAGAKGGAAKALKNNKPYLANATVLPEQTPSISDVRDHRTEETSSSVRSDKSKTKAVARAFPPDWSLSAKDREYALSKGLTHQEIDRAVEDFRGHFIAAGVRKSTDWSLNWQRWCRTTADRKPGNGAGLAGRQVAGRSGRGSSDLVAIVSKRRADREARMEVPGGEDTLFGEHHNWREGSIEGEYRASDQPYRNGDDARDETER